jgi:Thioesterase domains of type I polyketide synthases or non-ribosomal peptide synthetases
MQCPAEIYVPPRDLIELQLAQIWEEVLDLHPISVTSNFFDLGGSSLAAMTFLIRVQEQFQQELPLNALFETATVEEIAGILRRESDTRSQSPLVALQAQGSHRPFFCVHAVGGSPLSYIELARALGGEQPFYGFEARGLNGGAEPLETIEEMAAYYLEALRDRQPQGPYALGGWSFGGIVAFEMAQQLQNQGQEVALLAMLDSSAPGTITDFDPAEHATKLLADLTLDLISTRRNLTAVEHEKEHGVIYGKLSGLDSDAQLHYVLERACKANVLPPNAGVDRVRYLLQIFRSNLIALSKYSPKIYAESIVLFRAGDVTEQVSGPALGWQDLSAKPVEIHVIPGNHYTMLAKPNVQVLADELRNYLSHKEAQKAQN